VAEKDPDVAVMLAEPTLSPATTPLFTDATDPSELDHAAPDETT
jgi:hypothetical protein